MNNTLNTARGAILGVGLWGWLAPAALLLCAWPLVGRAQAPEPRLVVQSGDPTGFEIAVSAQGQWLARASVGAVQVWSGSEGRLRCTLPAADAKSLLFSADGKQLAALVDLQIDAQSTSRLPRRGLMVWDLSRCAVQAERRDDWYLASDGMPLADGRLLLRRSREVVIVDPFGAGAPQTLPLPERRSGRVRAYAARGTAFAETGSAGLQVVDLATGRSEAPADDAEPNPPALALSPGGRWLLAQSADGSQLRLYDRQARRQAAAAPLFPDGVPQDLAKELQTRPGASVLWAPWLGFSPDEQRVYSMVRAGAAEMGGMLSYMLQVRSLPDLRVVSTLPLLHPGGQAVFTGFALSMDGTRLAMNGLVGDNLALGVVRLDAAAPALAIWRMQTGRVTAIRFLAGDELLLQNAGSIDAAFANPSGASPDAAALRYARGYLLRWPLRVGSPTVAPLPVGNRMPSLVTADGNWISYMQVRGGPGQRESETVVANTRGFQPVWRRPLPLMTTLSPDGSLLAVRSPPSGTRDSKPLEIIETRTGQSLGEVQGVEGGLRVAFSPSGRHLLLTGNTQGVVALDGPQRLRVQPLPSVGYWLGFVSGAQGAPDALLWGGPGGGPLAAQQAQQQALGSPRAQEELRRSIESASPAQREAMRRNWEQRSTATALPEGIPVVPVDAGGELIVAGDPSGQWVATASIVGSDGVVLHGLSAGRADGRRLNLAAGAETGVVSALAFSPDGKLLAVAGADGTTTLWDLATRRWVARLYMFGDGTWVVLDPQGRFDTNRLEDIRQLHWVLPDEPARALPLEIFMRQYYEPRLLPRLLAGVALPPVPPLAQLNRAQPVVRIDAIAPDGEGRVAVTLQASATRDSQGRDGGVRELRLFRNGQLVARQDDLADGRPLRFAGVQLPSGAAPVEFSAYAFNRDGVKSETAQARHRPATSAVDRLGRAYVLAIGVNAYENPDWNLQFAANDARGMLQTLGERARRTGRYREVVAVPLIAAQAGERAAKAQIQAVLGLLAGQRVDPALLAGVPGADQLAAATPDDLVLITFSGHGLVGEAGRFHLLPSDIGTGPGRAVTPGLLARTVSSDDLAQWLAGVDAGSIAMVIDACYSASAVEEQGFKPGPMGSRGLGQLAYDKGIRILAASQAEDEAIESGALNHGLLTYALLRDGLDSGLADAVPQDRRIDLAEWLLYGQQRVPELYREVQQGTLSVRVPQAGRGVRVRVDTKDLGGRLKQRGPAQQPALFDFARSTDAPLLAVVE